MLLQDVVCLQIKLAQENFVEDEEYYKKEDTILCEKETGFILYSEVSTKFVCSLSEQRDNINIKIKFYGYADNRTMKRKHNVKTTV